MNPSSELIQTPMEIKMLKALNEEDPWGLYWRPLGVGSCRILPEDSTSKVESSVWIRILRDLEAKGYARRCRAEVGRLHSGRFKTRLHFRITPKGKAYLKELGL